MRAPAFWWQREPTFAARLLAPVGRMVGRRAAERLAGSGAPSPLPVICIGNPVAGGAGKTPTVLALGDMATLMGLLPAFLTRGYGGRLAGPVRVGAHHVAAEVGDEAILLAALGPTVVAHDRPAGAALALDTGADILIMDDGFQNPSLAKDLAILVVDGAVGIGNGLALPAGPLRAPLAAQFARADAVLVIGPGAAGERVAEAAATAGLAVHSARLLPDRTIAARLAGRRVIAFAGIGRPEKFAATLVDVGATVERLIGFSDHHPLTETEADRLLAAAGTTFDLVTTTKDFARLAGRAGPAFAMLNRRVLVLPVSVSFDDPAAIARLIERVWRPRPAPIDEPEWGLVD